jgi:hypothetical protein
MKKESKKWSNRSVFEDARKFENAKQRELTGMSKESKSRGNQFAREVLDPAKLPMKPPGKT